MYFKSRAGQIGLSMSTACLRCDILRKELWCTGAMMRRWAPLTRYTLQNNTASIKDIFWFDRTGNRTPVHRFRSKRFIFHSIPLISSNFITKQYYFAACMQLSLQKLALSHSVSADRFAIFITTTKASLITELLQLCNVQFVNRNLLQ